MRAATGLGDLERGEASNEGASGIEASSAGAGAVVARSLAAPSCPELAARPLAAAAAGADASSESEETEQREPRNDAAQRSIVSERSKLNFAPLTSKSSESLDDDLCGIRRKKLKMCFASGAALVLVVLVLAFSEAGDPDEHSEDGVVKNIAFASVAAGLLSYMMHLLRQPLLLGYILGGVLVGPQLLGLIADHEDIQTISQLGLILLLFMIGLELDLAEFTHMGRIVIVTGLLQFPICSLAHVGVLFGLAAAGVPMVEDGVYGVVYVGVCCSISSTMIVAKLLTEKLETDTPSGRLTIGVLIFQDVWAIVALVVQPNMASPNVLRLLKTFGMMAGLLLVSFGYSKFVLPHIMATASSRSEMLLILSLAWCFLMCCIALLPVVHLSMELAALISGVSMATFPYSAEFNGKIKYIRDFFITLYFVGLGMQIPAPTLRHILVAVAVALLVLVIRWLGIYLVVRCLGGRGRLASLATVNLSQVSEFSLVICGLGVQAGHVSPGTMTLLIWTFAILAVLASYLIGFNHELVAVLTSLPCWRRRRAGGSGARGKAAGAAASSTDAAAAEGTGGNTADAQTAGAEDGDGEGDDCERDILVLGLHRIGSALLAEIVVHSPPLLRRIHVVDLNAEVAPQLSKYGVAHTYGDISSQEVLEHAHRGETKVVLSTISDAMLKGTSNLRILQMSKRLWPEAAVIVTAYSTAHMRELYSSGADFVLMTNRLCGERLAELLIGHFQNGLGISELKTYMRGSRSYANLHAIGSSSSTSLPPPPAPTTSICGDRDQRHRPTILPAVFASRA